MYESAISKAGLNDKQAKIYAALLELGSAKAPEIARRAKIKRTTAYGVLDELVAIGIISQTILGKSKLFKAEDPQVLLTILETKKLEYGAALPQLLDLFSTHNFKPRIQFFEGKEGIKRIYEDTLNCVSKKICQIVKVKDFIEFPGGDFARKYIERRTDLGIVAYALHPKSGDITNSLYGTKSDKFRRHVRYLPPNAFYASMIMIYDDKVAMVSTSKENFGFIIESKEFSKTLEIYFQFMWGLGSKEPSE